MENWLSNRHRGEQGNLFRALDHGTEGWAMNKGSGHEKKAGGRLRRHAGAGLMELFSSAGVCKLRLLATLLES